MSSKNNQQNTPIKLAAVTSSNALRQLYEHHKGLNPKMSLAWLCRNSGIRSSGNLADIMQGKRRLNVKHAEGIASAFDLDKTQVKYFRTLVDRDHAASDVELQQAEQKLAELRSILNVTVLTVGTDTGQIYAALETFAAFGLLANKPSRNQLVDYFGKAKYAAVEGSLTYLLAQNFIRFDPVGLCYLPVTDHVALE